MSGSDGIGEGNTPIDCSIPKSRQALNPAFAYLPRMRLLDGLANTPGAQRQAYLW
jgi:hypothetical protein